MIWEDVLTMWVSIFVAGNRQEADKIMQRLDREGFLNRIRPAKANQSESQLEIQVLESDAPDAQQFCY